MREDAEAWRAYKEHPETFTFPGGESFAAQQRRVLEALRDAALTRRVALLVTHGGSIRLVRAFLEGRGIEAFHEMKVPNGEVAGGRRALAGAPHRRLPRSAGVPPGTG